MFGKTLAKFFVLMATAQAACSVVPSSVTGSPAPLSTTFVVPTTSPTATPELEPIQFIPGEDPPTPAQGPLLPNVKGIRLGSSYSFSHATWLCGGDFDCARRMLEDIACGLHVDSLRLMAPWDWLQDDSSASLKTDFNTDWQLATAKRCGVANVTMAIGVKTPHSPEFKIPGWAKTLSVERFKEALINYSRRFVEHYANDGRITVWQVENEPLRSGSSFGGEYPFDVKDFYRQEVQIVRTADTLKRPIIGTDSGDVGSWGEIATFVDRVGATYYRKSCGDGKSYFDHMERNGSPELWAERAEALKPKFVSLIELQWEPWPCGGSSKDATPEENEKSMNPQLALDNLNFVIRAGFADIDLWGLEWCLLEKKRSRLQMWELTQEIFAQR
ncbi:hypothetical protein HY732_01745 [Candidatus Uhrbacteria bacterium]|nr:hypothetical protein [Candidatus Uhrbacteria bacterium]